MRPHLSPPSLSPRIIFVNLNIGEIVKIYFISDEKYKLIMSGWADTSTSAAIQSVSIQLRNGLLRNNNFQEICRFESVHPNIYAVYELLQLIDNSKVISI